MDKKSGLRILLVTGVIVSAFVAACGKRGPSLVDDGGGKTPADFPELAVDVFAKMDGGLKLEEKEIKGRNTWNLWTGGNEQFWDRMARESFGLMDLLKTIDSRKRAQRFKEMGLINQPGYRQATKPDEYGLWIDEPVEPEPKDIDPKIFGRPTGIMGFRLFPNPDFNEEAKKKWDGQRYNNDADYAVGKELVRPYRIGISCGSCHIAFNPLNPPADPANPAWENLSSAIGNQYILEGRTFANNVKEGGLFWEMLKLQPAGTSDTSRIATDHINNPNMINPIFMLKERMELAKRNAAEELAGESLLLPGNQKSMGVPHVLKDGADSVGVPGATLRVYINIGMYSQHWLRQHNALIGLTDQKPFEISTAQKNSVFWKSTETKFGNIAAFFEKLQPLYLKDAPGGAAFLTKDEAVINRGKLAFANHCAECHSSKQPESSLTDPAARKAWFAKAIMQPDFLTNNFLSNEKRYPVTEIKTNAGRALGTNATRGHVWANFSSETYKNLPSVGEIEVFNPYSGVNQKFKAPAGGPGYYRPPSLISIWTSAPFLHNNALGKYIPDPSVAARMEAFNDAAELLLWPEKRKGADSIWRTTKECNVQIQAAVLPDMLRKLLKGHIDPDGYFRIGPIPAGTPVNLLANLNPDSDYTQLAGIFLRIKKAVAEIKLKKLDANAARELMKRDVAPALFAASKSPDFITDRGHEFGSSLPDEDKRALIEYLKML
jgi:hypothetical protein